MRDYKLLHGAILTKMAISINVNYQCIVEIILIGGDINIFSRYGTRGRAEKGEGGRERGGRRRSDGSEAESLKLFKFYDKI